MIKLDVKTRKKLNLSFDELALLIELEDLNGQEFKAVDMYKYLGVSKVTYYNQINRLSNKGYIVKGHGKYRITDKIYNVLNNKQ